MGFRLHPAPPTQPTAHHRGGEADWPREPARLVFPRAALDEARGARPGKSPAHRRSGDIVASIEAELEYMQSKLDGLKEDVESYKFPVFSEDDGPRPRAA